jgi:hypothetical protein
MKLSIGEYEDSGPHRDAASVYLACRMSELSEAALCASWIRGLEYHIWLVGTGAQEADLYDVNECQRLVSLGRELGFWWIWRDGPTRIPMHLWLDMLTLQLLGGAPK